MRRLLLSLAFLSITNAIALADERAAVADANEVRFETVHPGIAMAVVRGDPDVGAWAALFRFDAGAGLETHRHPVAMTIAVSVGRLAIVTDGKTREIGPGGYALVPAKLPHAYRCVAKSACVFYAEQPGKLETLK
jgi:quercetin dioxygenase-like cupin family protein